MQHLELMMSNTLQCKVYTPKERKKKHHKIIINPSFNYNTDERSRSFMFYVDSEKKEI